MAKTTKILGVNEEILDAEALRKAIKHMRNDFEAEYKKQVKTHKKTPKSHLGLASEELDDTSTPTDNTANDEGTSSSCCADIGSCMSWSWSFFKSIKIPQEYLDITDWLGSLVIKGDINLQDITTALILSSKYVAKHLTGTDLAAQAMQLVLQQMKDTFNLKIDADLTPDPKEYEELKDYCKSKGITIPAALLEIIDAEVQATPTPAAA